MIHRILEDVFKSEPMADPGSAGSIYVKKSPVCLPLVSAGAEARTLAVPERAGAILTLYGKTVAGTITVTVTSGYDEDGNTTFTLTAAGQWYTLVSVEDGSNFRWRLVSSYIISVLASQLTATAAEINARADADARLVNVTDASTYSVLAANSGKTHVMPDFTASCTLTLPTAAAGLEYLFVSKAIAADAQNWIFSTGGANFWLGGLSFADTDAGAGADEIHAGVWPNGSSNDFMTIVTPGAGTRIYVFCDGTNWIVNGQVFSATVPTFSDT